MEIDEAVIEYINECEEMLESISQMFGKLEKGAASLDAINDIYRNIHTIKGSSQLFGYLQIGNVAHAMEAALGPIREGYLPFGDTLADVLFRGLDIITKSIEGIKASGTEPDCTEEMEYVVGALVQLTVTELSGPLLFIKDHPYLTDETATEVAIPSASEEIPPMDQEILQGNDQDAQSPVPSTQAAGSEESASLKPKTNENKKPSEKNSTIRVQVSLLDNLMNLVGELVLIRNQVIQFASANKDSQFGAISQRINVVTTELQNEIMKTRMQPLGNIFAKFNRVIRDLAKELNKKVELSISGSETELDKTLIEAVRDPLTHIVRNAVDHGLEAPADRAATGKTDTGHIAIDAYHEGGQVVIDIKDDGRGIDHEKIAAKSVEKGIITQEEINVMSRKDLQMLIFAPGFSTAEQVSNISGRGVGMDVVKTNIEKIGGMVDIDSQAGSGTAIRLRIPLTLAIIPALIVENSSLKFAIPQVKLVELLRLENEGNSSNCMEILQGKPVYRLRGQLLPLVTLGEILDNRTTTEEAELQALLQEPQNIVVLNANDLMFGLIVDEIDNSADIVIKPLSGFLKKLNVYSGATVLGDGTVALALDVIGIANRVQFNLSKGKEVDTSQQLQKSKPTLDDEPVEYLIVNIGIKGTYAFPLCLVNRLEDFKPSQVEYSGDNLVVRYRGILLPIIPVSEYLEIDQESVALKSTYDPTENLSVVVIKTRDRLFGLWVQGILDVVAVQSHLDQSGNVVPGLLGNVIHQDSVIVVLDALGIVGIYGAEKMGVELPTPPSIKGGPRKGQILVVEDSTFFRKHIQTMLESSGYQVIPAQNGQDAIQKLQEMPPGQKINAIISDIEMPRMNGWEMIKRLRTWNEYKELPVIALTTKFTPTDKQRGLDEGFNCFLEKLNRNELMHELDDLMGHQDQG